MYLSTPRIGIAVPCKLDDVTQIPTYISLITLIDFVYLAQPFGISFSTLLLSGQ